MGVALLAWPYTVDDAYIVARYARNLVRGVGYAMNPGVRSDGVTGPLWVLPQLLALRLGLDPIAVAKLVGMAGTAVAVFALLRTLQARAVGRSAAPIALVLLMLSPSLGTAAVSGLETGAATGLFTIAALAAVRRPRVAAGQLGLCVAALAWLRPELALGSAVLLAHACWRDRRAGAIACALALTGALCAIAWRLWLFDDWLPLSFRAKAGSLAHGVRYTLLALVLASSLIGVLFAYAGVLLGGRSERVFAAALVAHLLALVLAGGDWMPGYRLLVPLLPLYAWLVARGITRALAARPRLLALAVALPCTLPALDMVTRIPELHAAGASQRAAVTLAARLRAQARVVALIDVGYLAYASEVAVVDLGGLTDPAVARAPGGHLDKRIAAEYVARRAPDALLLHSAVPPRVDGEGRLLAFGGYPVELRVASMPFVRERFRVAHVYRYASHYYYVLLTDRSGT